MVCSEIPVCESVEGVASGDGVALRVGGETEEAVSEAGCVGTETDELSCETLSSVDLDSLGDVARLDVVPMAGSDTDGVETSEADIVSEFGEELDKD